MHFDDGTFPFAARAEVPQETKGATKVWCKIKIKNLKEEEIKDGVYRKGRKVRLSTPAGPLGTL